MMEGGYRIRYTCNHVPVEVHSKEIESFKNIVRECELNTVPYQIYEITNKGDMPIRREYALSLLLR